MKTEKQRLIDTIEILENEKKQLLNSKEYQLGNSIRKMGQYIRHWKIKAIWNSILVRHRKKVSQKSTYTSPVNAKDFLLQNQSIENKKIAVYTCVVGEYDTIQIPLYYNDNVEYILFTDLDIHTKVWKKREIPEKIQKEKSPILINRYIKMHPKEVLPEYDYAIYIDGNIRTVSDISSFINYINNQTGLAFFRHHARSSIWQEKNICTLYKKGNLPKIQKQVEQYENEHFPTDFGLLECNVIVVDLKNPSSSQILQAWWEEFVRTDSQRDQISLPYVLWKANYTIDDVGNLGNDVYACPKIEFQEHKI